MGNGVSGEGSLGKDKSEGKGRSKMYPSSWLEDSSDSNHPSCQRICVIEL